MTSICGNGWTGCCNSIGWSAGGGRLTPATAARWTALGVGYEGQRMVGGLAGDRWVKCCALHGRLAWTSGRRAASWFKEVCVRTTVSLDTVNQLVEGRHENPFELLGPHEIDQSGRRAWRSGRTCRRRPGVGDRSAAADQALPMRRIHPAGLFEAICPMPSGNGSPRYMLRVAEENGRSDDHARSVFLSRIC